MPTPMHRQFRSILQDRIMIMDGAMGTMIQERGLSESDFRGSRFADHGYGFLYVSSCMRRR